MSIRQCYGRPVEILHYTKRDHAGKPYGLVGTGRKGFLMQWGTEIDGLGTMTYTVGIVELEGGKVLTVLPECIQFLEMIWPKEKPVEPENIVT